MKIETIREDTFQNYGVIFAFPGDSREAFYIVDQDEESPWRTALFRFSDKKTDVLERHPNTKETFEPLQGTALLLVASGESPEDFRCFLLDQAVSLKKGIWHQVLALSETAVVKITENYHVETEFYRLEKAWGANFHPLP